MTFFCQFGFECVSVGVVTGCATLPLQNMNLSNEGEMVFLQSFVRFHECSHACMAESYVLIFIRNLFQTLLIIIIAAHIAVVT